MPSLASELRSKVITPEQRLYTLGCQAVNAPDRAAYEHDTIKLIAKSESLIVALWRHYLETRIAPDMGGDALSSVRSGHIANANRGHTDTAAPHGPVEGEEGQKAYASANVDLPSSPSPPESGEANSGVPRGRADTASPLSPVDADMAMARPPQGQLATAGLASPLESGEARNRLPQGQACRASSLSPADADPAQNRIPQGQPGLAGSASPTESGEAITALPEGRGSAVSPLSPADADPAIFEVPQGQRVTAGSASPVRDGAGQSRSAGNGHGNGARSIAKPNPPRGPLAMALAQKDEDRKLFDSFKVRGGKPIGSLTLYEARQIAATNERESRVLRTLLNHIGEAWPGATIRDLINPQVLARAIGQNMEASDAA